jgi:hypothetical protein
LNALQEQHRYHHLPQQQQQQQQQFWHLKPNQQRGQGELNQSYLAGALDPNNSGSNMQYLIQQQAQNDGNTWQQRVLQHHQHSSHQQPLQGPQLQSNASLKRPAVVSNTSTAKTSDGSDYTVDSRFNRGLEFFNAELQGLYDRVMLRAGFTTEETSQTSEAYRSFAYQCWEHECNRLQTLLQDNDDQMGMAGNIADGMSNATTQHASNGGSQDFAQL